MDVSTVCVGWCLHWGKRLTWCTWDPAGTGFTILEGPSYLAHLFYYAHENFNNFVLSCVYCSL